MFDKFLFKGNNSLFVMIFPLISSIFLNMVIIQKKNKCDLFIVNCIIYMLDLLSKILSDVVYKDPTSLLWIMILGLVLCIMTVCLIHQ